jgi:hypothetical protein
MNTPLLVTAGLCALVTCLNFAALLDAEARQEPSRHCTVFAALAVVSAVATATSLILAAIYRHL